MDDGLLQTLLHTAEGGRFDVKLRQYAFAEEGKKQELVKDVLAMANAWGRETAYILIGVEEGTPHVVRGESDHPDDATLQQLVNGDPKHGRCNRRVSFSYSVYVDPGSGDRVGVIEVPVQQRPLYLQKDFGPLKRHAVYIRHGSTTNIADPDEIHKMGVADRAADATPALEVSLANAQARHSIKSINRMQIDGMTDEQIAQIEDYRPRSAGVLGAGSIGLSNPDFYRDILRYLHFQISARSFGLRLSNPSKAGATGVKVVAETDRPELRLMSSAETPPEPDSTNFPHVPYAVKGVQYAESFNDGWRCELDVGNVRPGQTEWVDEFIHLLPTASVSGNLVITVFANNLHRPVVQEYPIDAEVTPITDARTNEFLDKALRELSSE